MIKRRNFLKLVPVGLLAAKFGGLVELVRPDTFTIKPIKVKVICSGLNIKNKPTWAEVIPYSDENGNWYAKISGSINVTYI